MQDLMAHSNAIHGTKKLRRRGHVYTDSTRMLACQNKLCIQYIAKSTKRQRFEMLKNGLFR